MFSSQACSALRSHTRLSSCRWSASGRSLTGEHGSAFFEEPFQNPAQLLLNRKAHPKRHLICALISSLFFCLTGSVAVFYAIKSYHCERHGHYEQAMIYARRSFSWSMATYVLGLFLFLTLGLILFIRRIEHH